jgi:hypothetical protein
MREERSEAMNDVMRNEQLRRDEKLENKRADNLTMVFASVSGIVLAMVVTMIYRLLGGR